MLMFKESTIVNPNLYNIFGRNNNKFGVNTTYTVVLLPVQYIDVTQ